MRIAPLAIEAMLVLAGCEGAAPSAELDAPGRFTSVALPVVPGATRVDARDPVQMPGSGRIAGNPLTDRVQWFTEPCGAEGEPCCDALCDDSLYCGDLNVCVPCVEDEACTAEGGCVTGVTRCAGGARTCEALDVAPAGTACGAPGNACDLAGLCVACGGDGAPCCDGACDAGLGCRTDRGMCGSCPAGTVLVQSDAFDMGAEGPSVDVDESPVHHVTLHAFCIDATEVTVGAFEACAACGALGTGEGCHAGLADRPANCVTWEQASLFCGLRAGRLPTEAQWELAARGAGSDEYPWGAAAPSCSVANYAGCASGAVDVGSYAATRGVFDLAGNVSEWVEDYYGSGYYQDPEATDPGPTGPAWGTTKVVRGGSYVTSGADLRASNRDDASPDTKSPAIGFRCAIDPGATLER